MHQAHQHPHQQRQQQPTPTLTPDQANSQTANKVAAENGRRWQRTNLIYAQLLANYSARIKKNIQIGALLDFLFTINQS